ncbi:MAG: lamin tail domain-containing protein [Kofleriaceae bacterium]
MPRPSLLAATTLLAAACSNSTVPGADAPPPPQVDAAVDAAVGGLVINEIAAAGDPVDWFELVNTGTTPIDLTGLVFIDSGDPADAAPLSAATLAPGAYHVELVDDAGAGFKLGGDEELSILRLSDGGLVATVDWNEGDSPAGGSFARIPDGHGPFMTVVTDTQGQAND